MSFKRPSIAFTFLAALLMLSATMTTGCGGKKDAAATAEEFIGFYAAGDFESAFDFLAPSSYEKQQRWTADDYARQSESSYGGPYEVTELNFKPEGRKGDEVTFTITGSLQPVEGGENMVMGGSIILTGEDGAWLVSYVDWVAVPESSVPYNM